MSLQDFSPSSISNCELWIDAANPAGYTLSGANVTSVIDLSPSARSYGSASGFTLDPTGFQGRFPCFSNAANTGTQALGLNNSVNLPQPYTAFVVGVTTGGFRAALASGIVGVNTIQFYTSGSAPTQGFRLFAGTVLSGTLTNTITSPFLVCYQMNSNASAIFANGFVDNQGNTGSNTITTLRIGNNIANNSAWTGQLCEILLYNSVLTTFQRQQVEGYLYNKWGITALNPANPFRIYPAFQPTQLSNCAAWFDAADPKAFDIVNGNQVSTWFDKSGNGRNATNAFNSPVWNTSNTVIFSGSNFLNMPDMATVTPGNTFNVFFVGKRTSGQGTNYVFGGSGDQTRFNFFIGYFTNTSANMGFFGAGTTTTVPGYNALTEPRRILSGLYNATQRQIFINGSLANATADTTGLLSWANPKMGVYEAGNLSSVSFFGEVNELLFFVPVLSQSERQLVEGYLAWKWGLNTSLPGSNPYRFVPPGVTSFSNWPELIEANSQFVPGSVLLPSTSVLQNRIVTVKDIGGTFSTVTIQANTFTNTLQASTFTQNLSNPFDTQTYVASDQQWYPIEGSVQNALTTSSITANTLFTGSINYVSSVQTASIQMIDTVSNTLGNAFFPSSSFLRFGDEIVVGTHQASGSLFTPSQTAFNPLQTGSLHLWYDASDPETVVLSNGFFSQILDKSPFQRNSTGIIGGNLDYGGVHTINGKNCISFNLSGIILGDFGSGDRTFVTSTLSAFTVGTLRTNATANARYFIVTRDNETDIGVGIRDKAAVIVRSGTGLRAIINNTTVGAKNTGLDIPFLWSTQFTGSTVVTRLNGINTSNTSNNVTNGICISTNTFAIGGNRTVVNRYSGLFGELLLFSSFFEVQERQKVEGYLAWKWGLVGNLDQAHPYKNVPPSA